MLTHVGLVPSQKIRSITATIFVLITCSGMLNVPIAICSAILKMKLFKVSFSSENNLRRFLINRDPAQQQLESLFPVRFPTRDQQPASSQEPASDQLPTHVQLQLFLVIPDAESKDVRVVEVNLENHSACMLLVKESELFDYYSLFRACRTKINKTPSQGMGGCVCECDVAIH